jgi:15-cis-phytoene synthase
MPAPIPTGRTRPILKSLDAIYHARALPPGTGRYWSWFFAAAESRAPLLGIFALGAEWQALMDPATEASAARLKLNWWREEMERLIAGRALHPISAYLAALPRAVSVDFAPLLTAVGAAAEHLYGVPLERGADLEPQADALWGRPLALASRLAGEVADETALRRCTGAIAAAEVLSRAIRDYRREARAGRVPFAVDELLAAGVDNQDLAAAVPPPRLLDYLGRLHARAAGYFDTAAQALPREQQARQRHLLVLAALGRRQLGEERPLGRYRLQDMLLAWTTARRANRKGASA